MKELSLLFLLVVAVWAAPKETDLVNLVVKDIVGLDNKPVQVTVFNNCWDFLKSVNFMRTLMVPINFHDPNKQFIDDAMYDLHFLTFVIDLKCNGSMEFLREVPLKYFGNPFTWIAIDENDVDPNLFVDLPLFVDNNVIFVTQASQDSFNLHQFYKPGKDSDTFIVEQFGTWERQHRLQDLRSTEILSRRRLNVHQTGLSSSLVIRNEDTLNHLRDYRDRGEDSVTKYTFQIIDITLTVMNASKTYLSSPIWGYYNQTTQKYSGMMGHLVDGDADIGGTMLFMTSNRVPIVDYFCVKAPSTVQFLFRQPALSTVSNIYILPFTTSVWYCSAVLIVISCVVIFITVVLTNYLSQNKEDQNRFTDVILIAIGAICQMGTNHEPKAMSGRISFLFLFVALLFLYTSYTANIVALLQSTTNDIQSLEDMLRSRFEFGAEDNSYNRYYFKAETEPVRKQIYDTKIAPNDNFMNTTLGLERIRRGLFAFNTELGPAYKLIEDTFYEHEKCGLTEVKFIEVPEVCLALQKSSPYKEILKANTFKLRENGIVERELRKLYTQKPKCDKSGQNFESIGLNDCSLLITIILYGHILAGVIFLMEKYAHSHRLRAVCTI